MSFKYKGLREDGEWEEFESDDMIETPEELELTGFSEIELVEED